MEKDSNTLRAAEQQVGSLGLPVPGKPYSLAVDTVEWPGNVADLETTEVAKHLTWWTAWSGYARYHLARAETNHEAFATEYKINQQIYITKSTGDYKTVTEMKAAVALFPEMQELEAKLLKAEAETKLLKALLESYESKYKTVSREVSRRGAEWGEDQSRYKV